VSRLERALGQAARTLDALGAGWALVGGLAVSVRTEPRFTRDIDIAVSVADDAEAEALVRDHRTRGYEVVALVEQEETDRLATARLVPPGEDEAGIVVDLLFASSGVEPDVEPEIVAAADRVRVMAGLELPVARVGHLIAVKLLAEDERRPADRADLAALIAAVEAAELDRARAAIRLISERGFDRGRDLAGGLEMLLAGRANS